MAATMQTLEERATRRAPTRRQDLTLAPGVELGTLPTRAAKALAAAGLGELGVTARYIVTDPYAGGAPFKVVTEACEPIATITAARAFIRGLLFALEPPDQLAGDVAIARNEWARLNGRSGYAVQMWSWACGAPGCVVTACVRLADQGAAWEQIKRLGWATSATAGYLCPDHAGGKDGQPCQSA